MTNDYEVPIIISPPDYLDRSALKEGPPEAVITHLQKCDEALERTWGSVITQYEISRFLGLDNEFIEGLHSPQLGHLEKERRGFREKYVSDISRNLIAFGKDLCGKHSPRPEEIMGAISSWVDTKLDHVYLSDHKVNPMDMSERYRFNELIRHVHLVYEHLLKEKPGSEKETLDLAVKIAFRSVGRRGRSWLTHYGIVLYAFNIWIFNPDEYIGIFREPQIKTFQKRVSSIEDTARLHKSWENVSDDLRLFLSSNYIHNSEITYEELFKRKNGFTENGFRETYSEIAKALGIFVGALQRRYPRIHQAVLANDITILLEDDPELAPSKMSVALSQEAQFLNLINRIETLIASSRKMGDNSELSFIESQDRKLVLNILEVVRDNFRKQQELHTNELDYPTIQTKLLALLAQAEFERDPFYLAFTAEIPFTGKYMRGPAIIELLYNLLGDEKPPSISQKRSGLEMRDRFVAGALLGDFDQVTLSIQSFLSTLEATDTYGSAANILGFSPAGIGNFLTYTIIEGFMRSHLDRSIQIRLARVLNCTPGSITEIARPRESFDSDQLERAITAVFLGVGKIGNRTIGSVRARRQAVDAVKPLFTTVGEYPFMKSVLMGTYNGASGREISRILAKNRHVSSRLFTTLSEAKRYITERPSSKHTKPSET